MRTFPPVTLNPPGYLGDDDMLGGPSMYKKSATAVRRGRSFVFRGPGLNSSTKTPYPLYLPTHVSDWSGLGAGMDDFLGLAPLAVVGAAKGVSAVKGLFSSSDAAKDADRINKTRAEESKAMNGNAAAAMFVRQRTGQFGVKNIPGYGAIGGWGSAKARAEARAAWSRIQRNNPQVAAAAVAGSATNASGASLNPSPAAVADMYGTPNITPSALPGTNQIATAAGAVRDFAGQVAAGLTPDGDATPTATPAGAGAGPGGTPVAQAGLGGNPLLMLALVGAGLYALNKKSKRRR